MDAKKDQRIALIFLLPTIGIVIYWIVLGIKWLIGWLAELPPYDAGWWTALGSFLWRNISIVLVIYIIICLQVAGIAEFRYKRNFVKAFFLGICLTPPIMMAVYGRKSA